MKMLETNQEVGMAIIGHTRCGGVDRSIGADRHVDIALAMDTGFRDCLCSGVIASQFGFSAPHNNWFPHARAQEQNGERHHFLLSPS